MTKKDIVKAAQTLDGEDGEIPVHKTSSRRRRTDDEGLLAPKAIVSSKRHLTKHFVPLELRKEKKDGIGRPKGDAGREGFVGRGILDFGLDDERKKTGNNKKEYVAYGDARKDPPTTAEVAHASNLAFVKRIPDGAKPKLLKEVTFVLSKSNKGIKTVPNAVRYKCLYRLTAIRLADVDVAREDTVKVKEMVEEAERVECECFEASNGNKSTYLSKVAQFTKSNEFEKVTEEMFLPKGSMLQERRSETASKIDLAFCKFVRGSESIKFFRKAAKRARGEFAEDVREENNESLDVGEEEEDQKEEEHDPE